MTDLPRLARQSNGYNCGSTALHAAMAIVGLNPRLTPADIERAIGTNPVIGTTASLLRNGAYGLGIALHKLSLADSEKPIERLQSSLERNLVLLRTSIGGMRHWILAIGVSEKGIEVFDPASGYGTLPRDTVDRIWSARNYEAYRVPRVANRHPAYASERSPADIPDLEPYRKPIHEMTFAEFAGPGRNHVVAAHAFREFEKHAIEFARGAVSRFDRDPNFRRMAYEHPEWAFFAECGRDSINDMLVREKSTGSPVGVICSATTYVLPSHRGRGLGAQIVLAAYSDPRLTFLTPSHYSEDGIRARRSAYRIACAQAGVDPRFEAPAAEKNLIVETTDMTVENDPIESSHVGMNNRLVM